MDWLSALSQCGATSQAANIILAYSPPSRSLRSTAALPCYAAQAVGVLTHPESRKRETWMTDSAAKSAEYFITLEEQGTTNPRSCKDIPQSRHVRFLRVCRPIGTFSPATSHRELIEKAQEPGRYREREPICEFAEQLRQLVLHYVKAPCDMTTPIEEMWLDL
jgi:hypothetical protein